MAQYELDNGDASRIVTTMRALAGLVDQPDSPHQLTGEQLVLLTCPPGRAITRDREAFAANLRSTAAEVASQMPGDAPDVSGPYAFQVPL